VLGSDKCWFLRRAAADLIHVPALKPQSPAKEMPDRQAECLCLWAGSVKVNVILLVLNRNYWLLASPPKFARISQRHTSDVERHKTRIAPKRWLLALAPQFAQISGVGLGITPRLNIFAFFITPRFGSRRTGSHAFNRQNFCIQDFTSSCRKDHLSQISVQHFGYHCT
jgi:hypothetical protein